MKKPAMSGFFCLSEPGFLGFNGLLGFLNYLSFKSKSFFNP